MAFQNTTPRPQLIIVSGRPGAGKTTLARALSSALRCPLVSRDEIHDGIHRTLAGAPTLATKERLRELAFSGFFQAIEFFLSRNVSLVVEAAFVDRVWCGRLDPALSLAEVKVIQCDLDAQLATERVFQRRLAERDKPKIPDSVQQPSIRGYEPLSLPVPTIRVDTTDSYDPPFDKIVAFAETTIAKK
jgi:predicted kinase